MDQLLSALIRKTDEEKKDIWEHCLFVVDANILLNLYKYSESTRKQLIEIMNKLSDNLWIPHQVALEFLYNRTKKIHEQEQDYLGHLKAIDAAKDVSKNEIEKKLNPIKKPFRKVNVDELTNKIEGFFNKLKSDVEEKNSDRPNFNKKDIVLDFFHSQFSEKIGRAYDSDELEQLYKDGEERYLVEIPPGYEDLEDKKGQFKMYGDTVIKSEYGDLILWRQIIDKAKEDDNSVVFITDDSKGDWWDLDKGKKSPRNELINEFVNSTNQGFLMYNTESFLNNAKEIFEMDVQEDTIEEVKNYQAVGTKEMLSQVTEEMLEKIFQNSQNRSTRELLYNLIEQKADILENLNHKGENLKQLEKFNNELKTLQSRSSDLDVEKQKEINEISKEYNASITQLHEEILTLSGEYAFIKERVTSLQKSLK